MLYQQFFGLHVLACAHATYKKNMDTITKKWYSLGFLEGMENNEMVVTANLMEDASKILIRNTNGLTENTLDYHENVSTCIFPFIHRLVKCNPAMYSKSIKINIDTNQIIEFLDKNLKSHYDLFKPKGDDKELEFLTNLISNYL